VRCPFFRLDRFKFLPLPLVPPFLPITGAQSGGRGSIWMVLEGAAVLEGVDYYRRFRAGETVLVPASAGPLAWRPASTHEQPQSGSPVLLRAVW